MSRLIRLSDGSYINVNCIAWVSIIRDQEKGRCNIKFDGHDLKTESFNTFGDMANFLALLKDAGFFQCCSSSCSNPMIFINISKIHSVSGISKAETVDFTFFTVDYKTKEYTDTRTYSFPGSIAELHEALTCPTTTPKIPVHVQEKFDEMQRQLDELRADVMHMPGGPICQAAAESFALHQDAM